MMASSLRTILGQQTGKPDASNPMANTPEAIMLIRMIGEPGRMVEHLSAWEYTFYCDMHAKVKQYGSGLHVSGRQLFRLRDIKDRLVEKGVV